MADAIFNGVHTARMSIERPIPAQAFIAGEFCPFWYPSQPKTCRKCGAEDHLSAARRAQRCFNCEPPGHHAKQCDLPALWRVCLSDGHKTTSCPLIFYSSNVTGAKSAEKSYSGAAQSGKLAADTRKAEEESSRAKHEEEGRVHREKEKERKEKERNARNEKREIGIGRRRNKKKKNMRIAKNAREGSTTNTRREDTRMMMATGEKRGTTASRTAIAIALVAIGPLIATMKAMTVNQKVKDGPKCRIGEIRARVSRINNFLLTVPLEFLLSMFMD